MKDFLSYEACIIRANQIENKIRGLSNQLKRTQSYHNSCIESLNDCDESNLDDIGFYLMRIEQLESTIVSLITRLRTLESEHQIYVKAAAKHNIATSETVLQNAISNNKISDQSAVELSALWMFAGQHKTKTN